MVNPEQIAAARALSRFTNAKCLAQHPAVRSCRTPATRRAWRRASAEHRDLFVAVLSIKAARPKEGSMSTPSNTVPGSPLESQVTAPGSHHRQSAHVLVVRRELWEHRSIYIAPLAAAAVFLLAFLTGLTLSRRIGTSRSTYRTKFAAALIMGTGL